jgi:hypothetical protein
MEPIRDAIRAGDVAALRRLLADDPTQANTLINWGKNCQIWTAPLHYVSDMIFDGTLERTKALPLIDALLEAGAELNYQKPDRGESALIGAASLGAEEVGLRLLEAGADSNRLGLFGETALHWASVMGEDRLVRALIERGASVTQRDAKYAATPLGWAVHGWADPGPNSPGRYYDVIRELIAAGAVVDESMLSAKVLADSEMASMLRPLKS